MNNKKLNCYNAKCRRAFLEDSLRNQQGGKVKKYFKLLSRMGSKDQRFVKYLQSDLKYFVQKGGDTCAIKRVTKNTSEYNCILFSNEGECKGCEHCGWYGDICMSKEGANLLKNSKNAVNEAKEIEIYNPSKNVISKPNKNEV